MSFLAVACRNGATLLGRRQARSSQIATDFAAEKSPGARFAELIFAEIAAVLPAKIGRQVTKITALFSPSGQTPQGFARTFCCLLDGDF